MKRNALGGVVLTLRLKISDFLIGGDVGFQSVKKVWQLHIKNARKHEVNVLTLFGFSRPDEQRIVADSPNQCAKKRRT